MRYSVRGSVADVWVFGVVMLWGAVGWTVSLGSDRPLDAYVVGVIFGVTILMFTLYLTRYAFAFQWVEVDEDGFRAGTFPFPGRGYRWADIASVRLGPGGSRNMQPALFPTDHDGNELRGLVVQVESPPEKDWWTALRETATRHGVDVTGDGPWTDLDVDLRTGEVTGRTDGRAD